MTDRDPPSKDPRSSGPRSNVNPHDDGALIGAGHTAARMISGFSHEINNPLTAIQGLASLLAAEATGEQERKDLETIRSETERTIRSVRKLRTLAGYMEQTDGPAPLNDLVTHIRNVRLYELRAAGMDMNLDLDSGHPTADASTCGLALAILALTLYMEEVAQPMDSAEPALSVVTGRSGSRASVIFTAAQITDASPDSPEAGTQQRFTALRLAGAVGGKIEEERTDTGGLALTLHLRAGPQE